MKRTKTDQLVSPRYAAYILSVQPRTVVRWIHEGKIKGVKVGRVWRIPWVEVKRVGRL